MTNMRDLKLGMSGDDVRAMQLDLAKIGYALKGTGYFGPATDVAVETFQKRSGLTSDGEFGPKTRLALEHSIAGGGALHAAVPAAEVGRPLWLEAGLKLIGTKEAPGAKDNKVIIDWAHEEGGDIEKAYTHDSIPWCALFANLCLTRAGLKGTETLWALDFAGKWPSVRLKYIAVGAFAPMKRSGGGHIIQIVGRDQHGRVMGLGGNQSDQVSVEAFPISRLNQGFWWPASVGLPKYTGFSNLPIVTSNGKVSTKET